MKNETGWSWLRRGIGWVVAIATVQAMVLPALTMEQETLCRQQEHQHGDVCYTVEERLSCSPAGHIHNEDCLDDQGMTICEQEADLRHSHNALCFDQAGMLRCLLPEVPVHIHTEECYEEGVLCCDQSQQTEHVHGEACLSHQDVLTCSMEEHTHQESCFPTVETEAAAAEEAIEETTEETTESSTEETTIPTEPAVILLTEEPEAQDQTIHTAQAREDDVATVAEAGIRFKLFNYDLNINKDALKTGWRSNRDYFNFRNTWMKTGDSPSEEIYIPNDSINADHDADGFPKTHATVERILQNRMPVLDLTRNADGTARTDPGVGADVRSLAYLFGGVDDHAVTAYTPENTILQRNGSRYWYNSQFNAVDYDIEANRFRVRSYAERNSSTAAYGTGYGDFLPFDNTGGERIDDGTGAAPYHLDTTDVDYWFGMTMEVDFYQSKDGILGNENMVFRFSGDDDVWVFVDDVLVLDLGGTHGTVDGSIDFATGEILQYLSWKGANATEEARTQGSSTSFPTTLRACFDAAGRTPNGGWDENSVTFADYTKHTLTFFYLERGAAVANCKIDFSLPTLPDKSLTVSKELSAPEELLTFLSQQLTYRFQVVKPDGTLFLNPGTAYTLLQNGAAVGTGTIDPDGTFSLLPGQGAQFTQMLAKGGGEKMYRVQEILPDNLTGQYSGVEYSVNGAGGSTQTEKEPESAFTAYETELLSAEQGQLVTFRNRVDTSKLCSLLVSKIQEEGSTFPEDAVFPIQIKLGGALLPVGSRYQIGDTVSTVSTPGVLELKIGQTAQLLEGILSGTEYEVKELGTETGQYRARYSGTVSPEGTVSCWEEGAGGTFPLNSAVHITVSNASFDFAARIPLSKQAVHNGQRQTFFFRVQQVFPDSSGWTPGESLPGTEITVFAQEEQPGSIQIGYKAGTTGDFYYKVSEKPGTEQFLYDETYYIVQITAGDGVATVTGIWKNGVEELPPETVLPFLNHRTTALSVTKDLVGGDHQENFFFTAAVLWNGEPFRLPDAETVEIDGDHIAHFSLKHGESIILTGIPWGAEVTVREETHPSYIPSFRIDPLQETNQEGSDASVTVDRENLTIRFTNTSAYQLPQTGGSGTKLYTWAGLLQMAAAVSLLYFQRKRDSKPS